MKKLLSLMFILAFFTNLKAQPPVYDDLLILYADGNYPKLIKMCKKYATKDNSKKDPLVYLYLAKGYFKISFDADRDEEFKNAYKDVFGAASKCRKKDKDSSVFVKHREFFSEIKMTLVEAIENELDAKDYRKAAGWVRKVYKLEKNELGSKYLEGACKYRAGDKGGAKALWKQADLILKGITSLDGKYPEDLALLKMGLFETAECYVKMRQPDKAKLLLGKFAQWFEKDRDFKQRYDDIVN